MPDEQAGPEIEAVYTSLVQRLGPRFDAIKLRRAAQQLVQNDYIDDESLRTAARTGLVAAGLSQGLADAITYHYQGGSTWGQPVCMQQTTERHPI